MSDFFVFFVHIKESPIIPIADLATTEMIEPFFVALRLGGLLRLLVFPVGTCSYVFGFQSDGPELLG